MAGVEANDAMKTVTRQSSFTSRLGNMLNSVNKGHSKGRYRVFVSRRYDLANGRTTNRRWSVIGQLRDKYGSVRRTPHLLLTHKAEIYVYKYISVIVCM